MLFNIFDAVLRKIDDDNYMTDEKLFQYHMMSIELLSYNLEILGKIEDKICDQSLDGLARMIFIEETNLRYFKLYGKYAE